MNTQIQEQPIRQYEYYVQQWEERSKENRVPLLIGQSESLGILMGPRERERLCPGIFQSVTGEGRS